MAERNTNDRIIDLIKSKIIFEEAASFSNTEKDVIIESLCGSLKIILEWNVSCFAE